MHFSRIVTTAGWDRFYGRWGNGHDVWTQKSLTKSVQLVCGATEEIQDQDHQTEAWMLSISVQNYTVANSLQSSESTGDLTLILFLLWKFHSNFQTKERQEIDVILITKEQAVPGLPWCFSGYDSSLPMQEVWVQSLVKKLRSCMPHGVTPPTKKNNRF